jgi:hypothetical protein
MLPGRQVLIRRIDCHGGVEDLVAGRSWRLLSGSMNVMWSRSWCMCRNHVVPMRP